LELYFVNHGKINMWIEQVYFTVELENIVYTTATQSVSFAEFLLPRSQYLLTFNVHIATRRFKQLSCIEIRVMCYYFVTEGQK